MLLIINHWSSILDTASLVFAVIALYNYVVTDVGDEWLLLNFPR